MKGHNMFLWMYMTIYPCYLFFSGAQSIIFFCYTIFLWYKLEFFSVNNPKNLDASYKMDLDLWDFLGRVNLIL